jgi:integrase
MPGIDPKGLTVNDSCTSVDVTPFLAWQRARVLRAKGKPPAENTLKTKGSRLRVCCAAGGVTSVERLASLIVDRAEVERLLDALDARLSSGSVRVCVDVLRDFGQYAIAMKWIPSCAVLASDTTPANPQKPIVIYTPEEMAALLGNARGRGLRWWMFLSTVAYTGRRVHEVLDLEWDWLNLTADPPNFHLPTTKNGKQAYVPLGPSLTAKVYTEANIATLKAERRVGSAKRFGRDVAVYPFPWSYTCVHKMLAHYCQSIGVHNRGFHCLRHTMATNMLAKGVPIQAVSALLGHSSVGITDKMYNHTNALSYAHYVE